MAKCKKSEINNGMDIKCEPEVMPFSKQRKSRGFVLTFITFRGAVSNPIFSKIETDLNIYLTILTRFADKTITFINEA